MSTKPQPGAIPGDWQTPLYEERRQSALVKRRLDYEENFIGSQVVDIDAEFQRPLALEPQPPVLRGPFWVDDAPKEASPVPLDSSEDWSVVSFDEEDHRLAGARTPEGLRHLDANLTGPRSLRVVSYRMHHYPAHLSNSPPPLLLLNVVMPNPIQGQPDLYLELPVSRDTQEDVLRVLRESWPDVPQAVATSSTNSPTSTEVPNV